MSHRVPARSCQPFKRVLSLVFPCLLLAGLVLVAQDAKQSQSDPADAATADVTRAPILVTKYTGTGANLGDVRVRIYGTGLTSSTPFRVDQLVCGRTVKTGGITNGSTVTLAAATTNRNFVGANWILVLGGQNISGSDFVGAVSVTGISSVTTAFTFEKCYFGAATCPPWRCVCPSAASCGCSTAARAPSTSSCAAICG
jgi:hypothetical protein